MYKNLQTKTEIVETAMLQPLSHLKQTKKAIWLSVVTVEVKSKAFSAQISFTLVEFFIKMIIRLWWLTLRLRWISK